MVTVVIWGKVLGIMGVIQCWSGREEMRKSEMCCDFVVEHLNGQKCISYS